MNAKGWSFGTIFLPQGSGFRTFLVPRGWGILKKFPGDLQGGVVSLGIDRYIMSMISINFGLDTRNWPRINLQLLEFNFEFYFWRFRGLRFVEFQQRVKIVGLYVKLKTCSRSQKKSFKIIILTELNFISLNKATKNALSAK